MKKIFILISFSFSFYICCLGQVTSLPSTIIFERQVIQQTNGENGKGITTYYFTINGDYAMAKREQAGEDEKATILYTKDGKMCMIDEEKKIITILNMPVIVGEGGQMGKSIAEKIKKHPVEKDKEEKMIVTKTGKTKIICGYTAYEYEIKNEKGKSGWWYAKVDFDPIKIYTMGAGNAAMAVKIKGREESLKNNPMAIPALNQNYLMAEIEVAGRKGLETTIIKSVNKTINTTGYKIKTINGLKDIMEENNK